MILQDGDRWFVVILSNGQRETVRAHNDVHAGCVALNDRVRYNEKGQHTVCSICELHADYND